MRVAFISLYTAYPPTCGAGYVTSSCARLTPCEALLVQLSDRANIEHAGNLTIVTVRKDLSSRFRKLAGMPIAIMQICREIASFKPDHVVLEGASWAVYLALLGFALRKTVPRARIVYHAHNVEYLLRVQRENRIIAALTRLAERYLLTVSDRSFAASEEDRQRFSSLYGIMPHLLPNGIDCTADRATPEQVETVRQPKDDLGAVHLDRRVPRKMLDDLVQAGRRRVGVAPGRRSGGERLHADRLAHVMAQADDVSGGASGEIQAWTGRAFR